MTFYHMSFKKAGVSLEFKTNSNPFYWLDEKNDVSMLIGLQDVVGQKYLTTICCIKYILSP